MAEGPLIEAVARPLSDQTPGLRTSRPLVALREVLMAFFGLAVLGGLVYFPHILHGGLYYDDWADSAATLHPAGGIISVLSAFNEKLSSCRPVLILLLPLKYLIFGLHIKYLLSLAVLIAVVAAALLFAVLRSLGIPWHHAAFIASLTVVYPWSDSTRFWESGGPPLIAVIFGLAGLWLALEGLSRNSWRLHALAAVLYLLSVLTYEVTLPVIACAGFLYVARSDWRRARARWAVDLSVLLAGGLWDYTHSPRIVSSTSYLSHIKSIIEGGGEILGRTLLPVGVHTGLTLGILAGMAAVGVAMYLWRLDAGADQTRAELRRWLLLGLGGLAVAALGWVMFVPADPYYTPTIYGVTNRVNGVSAFGLVLVVYAVFGMVGTIAAHYLKRGVWTAGAITLGLALVLGVAYVHVVERHGRVWDAAYRSELTVAGQMESKFPRLPHETTVLTSDFPAYQALGVPIFASTWDLDGMIKDRYGDRSLNAYPLTEQLLLGCRPSGIAVREVGGGVAATAAYGKVRILNVQSGDHEILRSPRQCRMATKRYPPGPLYLGTAY